MPPTAEMPPDDGEGSGGGLPAQTCARCGHAESYLARPFLPWRAAVIELLALGRSAKSYKWWRGRPRPRLEVWATLWVVLLLGFHNLSVVPFRGKRSLCSWCHAHMASDKQERYAPDPFLAFRRHTPLEAVQRRRAAIARPNSNTAKWRFDGKASVLVYLAKRDGGRCGLCATPVGGRKTEIDHVVPKRFVEFDLVGATSKAVPGTFYRSNLHHVDNLQAAHPYCHKAKDDCPEVAYWRHPSLTPLPAAQQNEASDYLWIADPAASASGQ